MAFFINSRAALFKVYNDLKKFIFCFNIAAQSVYIAYLIYAIIVGTGILFANITLIALSAGYLVFYIVKIVKHIKTKNNAVETIEKTYRWTKIAIKAFTLGATLYGIHIATVRATTAAVIFAAFTTITWVMSVLFELVRYLFENYFELISSAVKKDAYPYLKVLNVFPSIKIDSPNLSEELEKKLLTLSSAHQEIIDAKKLKTKALKKTERKEKRKAAINAVKNKIKGILPKKKSEAKESDTENTSREKKTAKKN